MIDEDLKQDIAQILDAWTMTIGTLVLSVKLFVANSMSLFGLQEFTNGTMGIVSWFIAVFTMIWAFFRAFESVYTNYVRFKTWWDKRKAKRGK